MKTKERRHRGSLLLEPTDPRRIGSYDVISRLGSGGMGTVYLGISPRGKQVAIKLVHQHLAINQEFRSRFSREANAGRRMPAFCSAAVLETGTHEDLPYLVTEYIEGEALSELISLGGPLDLSYLHSLALGIAAGLVAIHAAGLVHRDIKPSNIIMALGGVRIIDFGIARALDETQSCTRTGIVMGSLGWAAPEQLEGAHPSPAMDVFAWGCVVAYAATGRHPFGPGGVDTRANRVLTMRPQLEGVPSDIRPIVEAALRRKPSERPTAQELFLSLAKASARRKAPRRVARVLLATVVGLLLAIGVLIGIFGRMGGLTAEGTPQPDNGSHGSSSPSPSVQPQGTGSYDAGSAEETTGQAGGPHAAGPVPSPEAVLSQESGTNEEATAEDATTTTPTPDPIFSTDIITILPTPTTKDKKDKDDKNAEGGFGFLPPEITIR